MVRRATLGFVPMSLGWRLVGGVFLGIAWTLASLAPVLRATESDTPNTVLLGVMFLVGITPALLAGRRSALAAAIAGDEKGITQFLGGRVKTAILWKDATVDRSSRVLQIADRDGRRISLVYAVHLAPPWLHGRKLIASHEANELVALATRLGLTLGRRVVRESPDGPPVWRDWARLVPIGLACWWLARGGSVAVPMMLFCFALLVLPVRRAARALSRAHTNEWIAFEGDELGLVRARRLDGARVLVDPAPAMHPDALVASRGGFVSAELRDRLERPSSPYRIGERVFEAVRIETQSDRVLRFERLRTAFVDVMAYGGLFAGSVAAVLVA